MSSTDIDGNVSGSVQSGEFHGPVGQGGNVTINMVPPPPPDTATHGERIRFITVAVMQVQQMLVEYITRNDRERKERQEAHDAQLDGITLGLSDIAEQVEEIKTTTVWLTYRLRIGSIVLVIVVVVLIILATR